LDGHSHLIQDCITLESVRKNIMRIWLDD
jgi:hypothetical protein